MEVRQSDDMAAGWHYLPQPSAYYLAGGARNLDLLADAGAAAAPEMHFTEHVGTALMSSQQPMMAAN